MQKVTNVGVNALLVLRLCQMMLIFAFEKLTTTVKDLCKLTGER